tara:strand:- start:443 stop:1180 length:738 start_codon:yes stop_codon:yes gene_type:complete
MTNLTNEKVALYASVATGQTTIDALKKDIKRTGSEIYNTMATMLLGFCTNKNLLTDADIDMLTHAIQVEYKRSFGTKSEAKGNLGMENASQIARDWATVAKGCIKAGANDFDLWVHTPSEMNYHRDLFQSYKTLGKDETEHLIASDESHKSGTKSGVRNTLAKINDLAIREELIKVKLLPAVKPLPEGLIMVSEQEHIMLDVIRTYLDGSSEEDVTKFMTIQTGIFSELLIPKVEPKKKKGKRAA